MQRALENRPHVPDGHVTGTHVRSSGRDVASGLERLLPRPGGACRGNVGFEE